MKKILLGIILILKFNPCFADSISVETSSPIFLGEIEIGPSSTEVSFNRFFLKYQFHSNFSISLQHYWNQSSVVLNSGEIRYSKDFNLYPNIIVSPNFGIGLAHYKESTEIQPDISTLGLSLNPNLDLKYKINEKISINTSIYYHILTFSSSILSTKDDTDILVKQMGLSLGVSYSW